MAVEWPSAGVEPGGNATSVDDGRNQHMPLEAGPVEHCGQRRDQGGLWPAGVRIVEDQDFALHGAPATASSTDQLRPCDSDCLPPGRGDACMTQAGFARHAGQTKRAASSGSSPLQAVI